MFCCEDGRLRPERPGIVRRKRENAAVGKLSIDKTDWKTPFLRKFSELRQMRKGAPVEAALSEDGLAANPPGYCWKPLPPCPSTATSSTASACPKPPPRNIAFARRFPRRRVPFLVFAAVFLLWTLAVVLANPADALVFPVVFAPPALFAYFGYWRRFRAEVGGFAMLEAFLIGAVPAAIAVMVLEIGVLSTLSTLAGLLGFRGDAASAATLMGFGPAISAPIGAVAGPPLGTAAEASSAASPASGLRVGASAAAGTVVSATTDTSDAAAAAAAASTMGSPPATSFASSTSTASATGRPSATTPAFALLLALLAASVEEVAKVVSLKARRPYVVHNPFAILLLVTAGSLGYATTETIIHVFLSGDGPERHVMACLERALFATPIHACCGALAAVNIIKRDLQIGMTWGAVLTPSVMLHMGFDLQAMLLGDGGGAEAMLLYPDSIRATRGRALRLSVNCIFLFGSLWIVWDAVRSLHLYEMWLRLDLPLFNEPAAGGSGNRSEAITQLYFYGGGPRMSTFSAVYQASDQASDQAADGSHGGPSNNTDANKGAPLPHQQVGNGVAYAV